MMRLARATFRQVQLWNWFCFGLVGLTAVLTYSAEVYVSSKQEILARGSATLSESIATESDVEALRSFAMSCIADSPMQPKDGIGLWTPSGHTALLLVAAFFFMLSALFTAEASATTLRQSE